MQRNTAIAIVIGLCLAMSAMFALAADAPKTKPAPAPGPGDEMLRAYLKAEVDQIARNTLVKVKTQADWEAQRGAYRQQLAEMLGLSPMPERTDLKATITGTVDHPQFKVERLHFQSRPGLYVTANLYIPRELKGPAPAILYVCGHGNFKKDGVSYGAKVPYQHWPAWFARNGYVCLIIDTLQLGEIEGIHHGTYREKMWWWHSRGYTPAGVEAWNSIRALDYLCSRPEVDKEKLGVTGRSGGGAYSWWLSAMDDRIKVAVPTAGITDLQNHVVDNCVEGHCDCMFMVNTYRWDYAQVAALVTPRPLLLANTDKDSIFPLDGVYRIHNQVRSIYELSKSAQKNFGLLITEGPHKDTQDLQVPAFRWFNKHLRNEEGPAEMVATKFFEPEQLRVFKQLPADQVNTRIQETFVPMAAAPAVPESARQWETMRQELMAKLKDQCFRAWPEEARAPEAKRISNAAAEGLVLSTCELAVQPTIALNLWVFQAADGKHEKVQLSVMDQPEWEHFLKNVIEPMSAATRTAEQTQHLQEFSGRLRSAKVAMAFMMPRGVGPTGLSPDERKRTHMLRRFYLVGTTLHAMQAYDVRRAMQAVRTMEGLKDKPLSLEARGPMAGVALYASLFEPAVEVLRLSDMPASHMQGPHFLNVLRFMDLPTAVAMGAQRSLVELWTQDPAAWEFPKAVGKKLGWAYGVEGCKHGITVVAP